MTVRAAAPMLKNALPQRLVKLRSIKGLSQSGLARLSGVCRTTIVEMEGGQFKDVMLTTVLKLCDALVISPNYLLSYDELKDIPQQLAPILERPTVRELRQGTRKCRNCERSLRRNEEHLPAECIVHVQEDRSLTREALASWFGFSPHVIDVIIADEYSRRAGRRRPPVISSAD